MNHVIVISEVGINANGNLEIAKKLIDVAKDAGCDIVKFQKRTVEDVYWPHELDALRESPFGTINRQQKEGLEFGKTEFDEIDRYCKKVGIEWMASAWDPKSQDFLRQYCLRFNKVASAMLTNEVMLRKIAGQRKYTFISTGMSTMEEIEEAVVIFQEYDCPFELMHCNSSYPMEDGDANLYMIYELQEKFCCSVGYSGHERGLQISLAAAAMGATSIERHITLDRTMYGSDQSASLEPQGLHQLVRDIRIVEKAKGDGIKVITEKEAGIRKKLANPYWMSKDDFKDDFR